MVKRGKKMLILSGKIVKAESVGKGKLEGEEGKIKK